MTAPLAPDAGRSRADGRAPRPSPEPGPEEPAGTAPARPDDRFADLLRRLRTSIDQGLGAGEIRDDVALDLRNVLADVRREVDPDDPREVRDGVARLREKVATRTREGAITRHRADELLLILDGSP
jgi:serine/threonine-protein kinase